MSRSATDATRFTSTGPYAQSKASASASPSSFTSRAPAASSSSKYKLPSGPPGETPKQKVERLRAQARAAKSAQNARPADKWIARGRVFADYAHRGVTYTLIGATGIATILTVYSMSSLVAHNRRQRTLFIEREITRLEEAQKAVAHGIATEEQLDLVRKEAIGDEYVRIKELEKARQAEKGWFLRSREALFGPVASEASGEKTGGVLEMVKEHESQEGRIGQMEREKQVNVPDIIAASTAPAPGPGQIDSLAENVAEAVTPSQSKSSWTSWIMGR